MHRRELLAMLGALGLPLGMPAAARAAPGPAVRVLVPGALYLVEGWVLTAADLRALGLAPA